MQWKLHVRFGGRTGETHRSKDDGALRSDPTERVPGSGRRRESMAKKASAEKAVRDIRRKTRRRFSAEEKIRIVIEGLRGEESIASLCRREGIAANLYYRWSKEFLEAGKKRLLGDTQREASSSEVTGLRKENARLKELVAETVLENRLLKKSVTGSDSLEDEA
jgi:transposase